jgi:hypothetical protein
MRHGDIAVTEASAVSGRHDAVSGTNNHSSAACLDAGYAVWNRQRTESGLTRMTRVTAGVSRTTSTATEVAVAPSTPRSLTQAFHASSRGVGCVPVSGRNDSSAVWTARISFV